MKLRHLFYSTFLLFLLLCKIVFAEDVVVLEGKVVIETPIVYQNKKVVVKPGTEIFVKGKMEHAIHIKDGSIEINGTTASPVVVNGNLDTLKDEEDINVFFLENSKGYISHTYFKKNVWALHVHFSDLLVKSCLFETNYGGIRLTGGNIDVKQNIFSNNKIGIRFLNSQPNINKNLFNKNDIAIFVREGVKNANIEQNCFYKNGYDIYLGFFQQNDVAAKNNFFLATPTVFDLTIDSSMKSRVLLEPVLKTFPDWH